MFIAIGLVIIYGSFQGEGRKYIYIYLNYVINLCLVFQLMFRMTEFYSQRSLFLFFPPQKRAPVPNNTNLITLPTAFRDWSLICMPSVPRDHANLLHVILNLVSYAAKVRTNFTIFTKLKGEKTVSHSSFILHFFGD